MRKVFVIAKYTLKDHLRSKVAYFTLALAGLIGLITFVATEFTYGVPEKVAVDFGLGLLSLSSLVIAIFMGVSLLSTEIESRTVYMIISRPVSRAEFIVGKISGMLIILGLNFLVLSLVTLMISILLSGDVSELIIQAMIFCFLESVLALLIVLLFSLGCNTFISSAMTVLLVVVGHGIKETNSLSFVVNRPMLKLFLDKYHLIFPAFYKLNLKDFVLYKQAIPYDIFISNFLYGFFYSLTLFLVIIFIFEKKNID